MSDDAATESGQEKKAANPMVMMLMASLVTAGVVGGGLYFTLASKVEQAAAAAEHGEEGEGGGEGGEAKGGKKPKAEAIYVKLDPPFVVNFEAKGIMRFLQITVEVMTRDPHTEELLKQHDPMIRNNLLMLFGNQDFEKINSVEGKEALRAEALKNIGESLKTEGGKPKLVEQLYFTSFVMQ